MGEFRFDRIQETTEIKVPRSDIRHLFFEPSPKLFPKLWVIAARFADPRPWDEILQYTT